MSFPNYETYPSQFNTLWNTEEGFAFFGKNYISKRYSTQLSISYETPYYYPSSNPLRNLVSTTPNFRTLGKIIWLKITNCTSE